MDDLDADGAVLLCVCDFPTFRMRVHGCGGRCHDEWPPSVPPFLHSSVCFRDCSMILNFSDDRRIDRQNVALVSALVS